MNATRTWVAAVFAMLFSAITAAQECPQPGGHAENNTPALATMTVEVVAGHLYTNKDCGHLYQAIWPTAELFAHDIAVASNVSLSDMFIPGHRYKIPAGRITRLAGEPVPAAETVAIPAAVEVAATPDATTLASEPVGVAAPAANITSEALDFSAFPVDPVTGLRVIPDTLDVAEQLAAVDPGIVQSMRSDPVGSRTGSVVEVSSAAFDAAVSAGGGQSAHITALERELAARERQVATLTGERDVNARAAAVAQDERDALQDQLDEAQQLITDLQRLVELKDDDIAVLQTQVSEYDAVRIALADEQSEVSRLSGLLASKESLITVLQDQVSSFQARLEVAEAYGAVQFARVQELTQQVQKLELYSKMYIAAIVVLVILLIIVTILWRRSRRLAREQFEQQDLAFAELRAEFEEMRGRLATEREDLRAEITAELREQAWTNGPDELDYVGVPLVADNADQSGPVAAASVDAGAVELPFVTYERPVAPATDGEADAREGVIDLDKRRSASGDS